MTSPPPHLPPLLNGAANGHGHHHIHGHGHAHAAAAHPPPPPPQNERPSTLAALLAGAYADAEAARRETRAAVRRAEAAERAYAATQPSPGGTGEKTRRAFADEQARADAAERERDDARERLRAVADAWDDFVRFRASCEGRVADASAGFARTLHDATAPSFASSTLPPLPQTIRSSYPTLPSLARAVGGSPSFGSRLLPPPQLPPVAPPGTFAHITLPTPPQAHRRTRDASPDVSYANGQHPAKRARPDAAADESPRGRTHRRSGSRASSSSSMSLDKMLLEASGEQAAAQQQQQQAQLYAYPPFENPMRPDWPDARPRSRASPLPFPRVGPAPPPPAPTLSPPVVYNQPAAVAPAAAPLAHPAPVRELVHPAPAFVPAPKRGSKPPGASSFAAAPPSPAPGTGAPPGARLCRQCGQPGRYKDGKCVEKWGPGPDGPGTVCDRCRKKMKRVERRGEPLPSASRAPTPPARNAYPEDDGSSVSGDSLSPAPVAPLPHAPTARRVSPARPPIAALGADGRRTDVGGGGEDEMDAELLEAVDAADARRGEWTGDEDE